jgi:hypothetical protein
MIKKIYFQLPEELKIILIPATVAGILFLLRFIQLLNDL